MIIFLTSSPTGDLDGKYTCEGFDSRNGFADEVRKVWRENARVLMITAFPYDEDANRDMKEFFHQAVMKTGLSCSKFNLWDGRILENPAFYSRDTLHLYDVIILGGGHVPTQIEFLNQLGIKESIKGFSGLVIGISAGSMNCAETVYSIPEEPGEAVDSDYRRFFPGLGITGINILPHYQLTWDGELDGMRLYSDIAIPDSQGHRFISIPDGSYVIDWNGDSLIGDGQWITPQKPEIHGEAYLLENGIMKKICSRKADR